MNDGRNFLSGLSAEKRIFQRDTAPKTQGFENNWYNYIIIYGRKTFIGFVSWPRPPIDGVQRPVRSMILVGAGMMEEYNIR